MGKAGKCPGSPQPPDINHSMSMFIGKKKKKKKSSGCVKRPALEPANQLQDSLI